MGHHSGDGVWKHQAMVCPACSRRERKDVACSEYEGLDRWAHAVDGMAAAFKSITCPVTGLRIGNLEVGAECDRNIDELAKWVLSALMRQADVDLKEAARQWVLHRLDVPTKEAEPSE